ncbi:hypothetical protein C8R43DRAFT_952783 [Mycena crocata]|nr:hypothetical protein C8R43DRAFT_952783 [Mycena crocata]
MSIGAGARFQGGGTEEGGGMVFFMYSVLQYVRLSTAVEDATNFGSVAAVTAATASVPMVLAAASAASAAPIAPPAQPPAAPKPSAIPIAQTLECGKTRHWYETQMDTEGEKGEDPKKAKSGNAWADNAPVMGRSKRHGTKAPNISPAGALLPAERGTLTNPANTFASDFEAFTQPSKPLSIPIFANACLEWPPKSPNPHRVFVHPAGGRMGVRSLTQLDSYESWKAEIQEVRTSPTNEVYLRVVWYYNTKDIVAQFGGISVTNQHMVGSLSQWDLMRTSHASIIKASSVTSRCSIRHYDSDDLAAEWQTHTQWICRYIVVNEDNIMKFQTIAAKYERDCYCGAPYNPWTQRQAYCQSCKRWMHIIPQCAKRVANMDLSHLGHGKSIVDHILDATIVRGYGIASEEDCDADDIPEDEHWWVVGWHRLHQFCSQNSVLPKDWQEKKLGDGLAVSSGWPRNEPEKRAQFAKTLMQHIKKRPVKVGFECPSCNTVL